MYKSHAVSVYACLLRWSDDAPARWRRHGLGACKCVGDVYQPFQLVLVKSLTLVSEKGIMMWLCDPLDHMVYRWHCS